MDEATPSILGPNFGGGFTGTVLHPAVAVAMIVAIVGIFGLPRKYAVVPLLLAFFLVPVGQELYIGGVHLYVNRIIVGFGFILLAAAKFRSKTSIIPGGWKDLDTIFITWAFLRATAVALYYWGNTSALINQIAFLWDTLGGYFLLRYLIRDKEDIGRVAKTFAVIVGILGLAMLNERFRNQNLFGYLGTLSIVPTFREGNIRAQGPFEHPLLAGTFAATLFPFFIWLWHSRRSRILAAVGVVGCTAMVFSSSSSTPLLAYLAVILGVAAWPLRGKLSTVRWVVVGGLIIAQMFMNAPVWFLMAHVDLIAGNSGWHRAALIDSLIRHFSDWWLIGTNKAATWGFGMDDLCEQWVAEGETGGLATLVCFILLIWRSFSKLGKARKRSVKEPDQEWLLWFIGVALFSHCVGFFGISYFDQTEYSWLTLLCIISVATGPAMAAAKESKQAAAEPATGKRKMLPAGAIASAEPRKPLYGLNSKAPDWARVKSWNSR